MFHMDFHNSDINLKYLMDNTELDIHLSINFELDIFLKNSLYKNFNVCMLSTRENKKHIFLINC